MGRAGAGVLRLGLERRFDSPALGTAPGTLNGARRTRGLLLTIERNRGDAPFVYRKERRGRDKGDVLQGTLDMLVLKALQLEAMHGWGITERIEQWSENVLQLGQGTLYPALYRLERQGLIRPMEDDREQSARALLRAHAQGRKHFADELAHWRRMSRAINLVHHVAIT